MAACCLAVILLTLNISTTTTTTTTKGSVIIDKSKLGVYIHCVNPPVHFFVRQKLFLRETLLLMGHHAAPVVTLLFSLTHVTCMALHYTVVIRYITSVTYKMLCHASGHLVINCECYWYERAIFTLSRFLAYIPSCWFQGFPGASSSTSKLAGLHASLQNIALACLFLWITTIHNKNMLVGSI